jgi:K+-sensing histidine kinase KdpD
LNDMPRLPATGSAPRLGYGAGVAIVAATTAALVPVRAHVTRATPALVLVLAVVAAGWLGGLRAAIVVAFLAALVLNVAFIEPFWTLKVAAWDDWVALGVFLIVAMAIGALLAALADRERAAQEREAESRTLYERLGREADRTQVLEQIDEQRAALLRSVSHDLRTPLATIRAVATDLRDGVVYDDETRVELLSSVCDEAERLDRLVGNLLSMSRIEAGALKPDRQAVDIDELVADRVRRLRRLFDKVRLQVDVAPDLPLVDGDYTQLDQVLTNLMENAARHAPQGSIVRVEARLRGGVVEVRVADEGIGVPPYLSARIFEPFRREEGSRSSGVGLAICKAIVEAHGGSIGIEDTPGGGATFAFTLPVRRTVGPT